MTASTRAERLVACFIPRNLDIKSDMFFYLTVSVDLVATTEDANICTCLLDAVHSGVRLCVWCVSNIGPCAFPFSSVYLCQGRS